MNLIQRWRVNGSVRLEFYRALAKLIRSGSSTYVVVRDMSKEFRIIKHPLLPVLEILERRLRGLEGAGGKTATTFGQALLGMVPVNEALIIDAGETGGKLIEGLELAANYVERTNRIYGTLRAELSKPVLYIGLVLALFAYFGIGIFPQLTDMSPRKSWPEFAQTVGSIADAALAIVVVACLFIVASTAAVLWLSPRWSGNGRDFADQYLFPFTFIKHINAAAMLTSLSAFLDARMPFDSAIKRLSGNASSYMQSHYAKLRILGRNAVVEHEALCQLTVIDRRFHWLLRLHGRSGDLGHVLQHVSSEASDHVERSSRKLGAWVVFFAYMAMAATVIGLIITMLLIASAVGQPAMKL
jgi:type II secretory pathway component PulF